MVDEVAMRHMLAYLNESGGMLARGRLTDFGCMDTEIDEAFSRGLISFGNDAGHLTSVMLTLDGETFVQH